MFKSNLKKKSNIQILPMIDVIFFLLVFFMLFTTFKTTPTGLEINLPKATTVTDQKEDLKVNLMIDKGGKLYFDDKLVAKDNLEFKLNKVINKSPDTLFIIKADQQVKYENIINLMDLVRKSGGYRLALAADKEGSN